MRRRSNQEVISGRVNADGTIATGEGYTVVKGGVGVYSIKFRPGFILVACTFTKYGSDTPWYLSGVSESQINYISVAAIGAGGNDVAFMFVATGIQK